MQHEAVTGMINCYEHAAATLAAGPRYVKTPAGTLQLRRVLASPEPILTFPAARGPVVWL